MVWNITKDGVRTRMAVADREAYPTPPLAEKVIAEGCERYMTPEWVLDGWPKEANDMVEQIYEDFNKEHGTDSEFELK